MRQTQPYLPYLEPPPRLLLPAAAQSLEVNAHPSIPQLNGSDLTLGAFLGSGIDKSAFLILDEKGEPRDDIIIKLARHQNDCRDNNQCQNELDLWNWMESVQHPYRVLFAGVVSILTEVTCDDECGTSATRICYTCERVKKAGYDADGSAFNDMSRTLSEYFGMYDLHRNNIGTAADGRPVVLDYGLLNGLRRIQDQWNAAAENLDDDATPDEILESIEPLYSPDGEYDDDDDGSTHRPWCDECDCRVSEEHCHCTECNRDRRGGEYCDGCHTITNESSRYTHTEWDTSRILCATCLRDARNDRTPKTTTALPNLHPNSDLQWRMYESCDCDECIAARAVAWEKRKEEIRENARQYSGMRVSVHRIESAPPLVPIKK